MDKAATQLCPFGAIRRMSAECAYCALRAIGGAIEASVNENTGAFELKAAATGAG